MKTIVIGKNMQSDAPNSLVLGVDNRVLLHADFSEMDVKLHVANMGGDGLFENLERVFLEMARAMRDSRAMLDGNHMEMN